MQGDRERQRHKKEKSDQRRQHHAQRGKPEQFSVAEGDGNGRLEKLPTVFNFLDHNLEGFLSWMKFKSSLSVKPLLDASANRR